MEYFHGSQVYDEVELLQGFKELLEGLHFQGQIILELGRFIAANCGQYYTEIVDYKVNQVPYCIVDGGMHQITYYGQMMAMKIPHYRQIKKEKEMVKLFNVMCPGLCVQSMIIWLRLYL